jgi:hypothetical protein
VAAKAHDADGEALAADRTDHFFRLFGDGDGDGLPLTSSA